MIRPICSSHAWLTFASAICVIVCVRVGCYPVPPNWAFVVSKARVVRHSSDGLLETLDVFWIVDHYLSDCRENGIQINKKLFIDSSTSLWVCALTCLLSCRKVPAAAWKLRSSACLQFWPSTLAESRLRREPTVHLLFCSSRNLYRCSLPVAVFGSSGKYSIHCGFL